VKISFPFFAEHNLSLRNRSGFVLGCCYSKGAARNVGANEVVPIKAGIQLKMLDETVVIRENSTDVCRE